MPPLSKLASTARRFRLPPTLIRLSVCDYSLMNCGSHHFCSEAMAAAKRAPKKEEPQLPEHLQRIVDAYDKQQAAYEAEAFGRDRPWLKKLLSSKYANLFGMVTAGIIAWGIASLDDVSSEVYTIIAWILRKQSRESAQRIWIAAASRGLTPKDYDKDDPYMVNEPMKGMCFYNPVGLSSGFDSEARGVNAFFNLGFGFVEAGPVNANTVDAIRDRLASRDRNDQLARLGILGVNLGGNATEIKDFVEEIGNNVDFFVIDLHLVSKSEHTEERLTRLIAGVVHVASDLASVDEKVCGLPVFLRIPEYWPEEGMSAEAQRNFMEIVSKSATIAGATGLIFKSGDGVLSDSKCSLLKQKISEAYKASGGNLILIADGISTGLQALECVEAGATLVQISSLLLTEGPNACRRLKSELNLLLSNEGYYSLKDAVGAAHRRKKKRWKSRN